MACLPLPARTRCRHRHRRAVLLPLVTEFTRNFVRVAETRDGLCLRWIRPASPLDAAIWTCFSGDVLAEARTRLVAGVAQDAA